ncbi:MAG: capsule biosynthesis protein [Bacteroidales bacterium]|jgi:protein involved in polysaccharide export with SLBB domain|nr:capsule biosynthesis protein [Bacteroidales bacterium]
MKILKSLTTKILVTMMFVSSSLSAININSLENVTAESLSTTQVKEIKKAYSETGRTMDEFVSFAVSKGMKEVEAEYLKKRILADHSKQEKETKGDIAIASSQMAESIVEEMKENPEQVKFIDNRIFGSDLFSNSKMTFAPSQNIPTPKNYIVGPGDVLIVDVYGYAENTMNLTVSSEGSVRIPNIGPVMVNGLTIEAVQTKIKKQLSSIYSSISSGNTQVSVTIGNVKSIDVYITGNVAKPGTYTLSSLSTVYNALYACSGPTTSGSLRNIKVMRNGKEVTSVDLYTFLTNGNLSNNISLRDQDVIYVPAYDIRVSIDGAMKRPGVFEMKQGETLKDLLSYAGGFSENAYRNRIMVQRTTEKEKSVADVSSDLYGMFQLQTGDQFVVSEVLDKYSNRVKIYGGVFRPGPYALDSGMTLMDLVKKADGLVEDAYLERATITRLRDDLTPELISFNVKDLIDGKFNLLLKKEDEVTIGSLKDLEEKKSVSIYGQVLAPGRYPFYENMTVKDLIFLAKGFKEFAATDKIELSRRVKDESKLKENIEKNEIKILSVDKELSAGDDADIKLEPNDMISVRLKEGVESSRTMSLLGEVRSPGDYVIINKREKISDIMARAGGTTNYAYVQGAFLIRKGARSAAERMRDAKMIQKIAETEGDPELLKQLQSRTDLVGIDMERILKRPGCEDDIYVEDGDVIYIPKQLQTITVNGKVQVPGMMVYQGRSARKAIRRSGGFGQHADKRHVYVAYANGEMQSTGHFAFFKNYPKIKPGAHLYVPEKEETNEDRRARANFVAAVLSTVVSCASVGVSSFVVISNLVDSKKTTSGSSSNSGSKK